jgi:hypothetical protein
MESPVGGGAKKGRGNAGGLQAIAKISTLLLAGTIAKR